MKQKDKVQTRPAYLSEDIERYLSILNAVGHSVIATDMDGTIGYWNDAATALYGWDREEVLGRNILDVTPAQISRAEGESIMRTLAAGEVWSGTFDVRHRDGHAFRAAVTDLPLRQRQSTIGVVGMSAPETSRAPLSVALARFCDAAESVQRGSVSLDRQGIDGMVTQASEPHLIQLFTLLYLRQKSDSAPVTFSAECCSRDLLSDFGMMSEGEWAYVRVGRGMPRAESKARQPLRAMLASPYAASLVSLAGGMLFAGNLPRSTAAFHLFLPVN